MVLKICIIIPIYNEEAIIERNLETIIKYAQALPDKATVVAVNDGSRDLSEEILMMLEARYPPEVFYVISYKTNRGYGGALKEGMHYAIEKKYNYVILMDSDLTNHPKYLTLFYSKMGKGYEYIKATRYREGGKMEGVPWKRRIFSRVANMVARTLIRVPLTDPTNGFRAVKVALLRQMDLKENGFPIIMEELYEAKGLTRSFGEIPYTLTSRNTKQGATHFPYTIQTIKRYLYYALKSFFICLPQTKTKN